MATSIGGILINVHFFLLFLLFYNDVNFKYFFGFCYNFFHISHHIDTGTENTDYWREMLLSSEQTNEKTFQDHIPFLQRKREFSYIDFFFIEVITTFLYWSFWTTGIQESFSVKNLNCYRIVAFPDSTLLPSLIIPLTNLPKLHFTMRNDRIQTKDHCERQHN